MNAAGTTRPKTITAINNNNVPNAVTLGRVRTYVKSYGFFFFFRYTTPGLGLCGLLFRLLVTELTPYFSPRQLLRDELFHERVKLPVLWKVFLFLEHTCWEIFDVFIETVEISRIYTVESLFRLEHICWDIVRVLIEISRITRFVYTCKSEFLIDSKSPTAVGLQR